MKPYVSIDIETTSLDPFNGQVIEFAAVLDDGRAVENLPMFHRLIEHDEIYGEPRALAMNAAVIHAIATRPPGFKFCTAAELGRQFAQWCLQNKLNTQPLVVAGKNFSGFDRQFLQRLPGFTDAIQFHHRAIDPTMLFWNPEADEVPPATADCLTRAGLPAVVDHRALSDALNVVRLIRVGANRLKGI